MRYARTTGTEQANANAPLRADLKTLGRQTHLDRGLRPLTSSRHNSVNKAPFGMGFGMLLLHVLLCILL